MLTAMLNIIRIRKDSILELDPARNHADFGFYRIRIFGQELRKDLGKTRQVLGNTVFRIVIGIGFDVAANFETIITVEIREVVVDAGFLAFPKHDQIRFRIRELIDAVIDTAKALMSLQRGRPLNGHAAIEATLAIIAVFVETKMGAQDALVVLVRNSSGSGLEKRKGNERKGDQRTSHCDRKRTEETKSSGKVVLLMKD